VVSYHADWNLDTGIDTDGFAMMCLLPGVSFLAVPSSPALSLFPGLAELAEGAAPHSPTGEATPRLEGAAGAGDEHGDGDGISGD